MLTRRKFTAATLIATFGGSFAAASRAEETKKKETFEVMKTDEEWRKILSPEQYRVLREHGTERARTSPLDKTYAPGKYTCAGCGQELYLSDHKFNSGTGWPSFYQPAADAAVGTSVDKSYFMTRTEVHCSRCGGHLGHIFDDGPAPTGKRHCINGVALKFVPAKEGA
ncbi:MAG: peptide-methionine (R)-S-oxide reductase MsrB [Hyphomicrobiaceae bacterium]